MNKYQVWSTLAPALWKPLGSNGVRIAGGTVTKLVYGKREIPVDSTLPEHTTLAHLQWMKAAPKPIFQPKVRTVQGSKGNTYVIKTRPDGKEECSCPGYQYRRFCKHTGAK